MRISREFCLKCKGRLWCGLNFCPLIARFNAVKNLPNKGSFDGSSVDVFVSRFNYPNVDFGIISVPEVKSDQAEVFENHKQWITNKFTIDKIVSLRSNTMYNYDEGFVKKVKYGSVDEIGLSKKPVEVNVELKNKPKIKLKSFVDLKPFGAKGKIRKVELQETPKIPQKVEKVLNDEMKADVAITTLYHQKFDEDYIRKVFSMGKLGINKKLVPTRWSITAVDDNIGKHLISKIREFNIIQDYQLFLGSLYGNYFLVLLIPQPFSYELFEMISYQKSPIIKPQYTHDYEIIFDRKKYADSTAGGYYASRLGVLEYLFENKIQASVLVLRFVTPEYVVPLGVWVVRNAVRNAMKHKIMTFDNLKYAKKFIIGFAKRNFYVDLSDIFLNSHLLTFLEKQKRLDNYF